MRINNLTVDAELEKLQHQSFNYFLHETNPANGLVIDKTEADWPASIAATGLALASYPVAVERGFMPRAAAVERTLTTLRFFWNSPQGSDPNATGYQGFYYHFLDMQPGERLLDIGCGWSRLARYAAKNYGVNVLGVTLSKNQKDYADEQIIRAGFQSRVAVELKDYRDLGDESFDKIVSVGMFEHVGRSHLPEYFAQVYRLLKSGGLFLNHGISRRAGTGEDRKGFVQQHIFGRGSFLQRYIFPDAELIPVSDVNVMAENAGFKVRDVENLREHYALTLCHWVSRLAEHREQAIKVSDEVTYRTWRLYMSASAYGFESGNINVNQTLLAKVTHEGKSNVPLSRADLYTQR